LYRGLLQPAEAALNRLASYNDISLRGIQAIKDHLASKDNVFATKAAAFKRANVRPALRSARVGAPTTPARACRATSWSCARGPGSVPEASLPSKSAPLALCACSRCACVTAATAQLRCG
jgi:hypothetical protein